MELDDDARTDLIAALARFTRVDPAPFVSGHIVLPNDEDFPDVFEPTEACLDALAQRLLVMAGMKGYAATVELGAIDAKDVPETRTELLRIEGRLLWLLCSRLGRAEDAALSLAHEIARAGRLVHGTAQDESAYRTDGRPEGDIVPEGTDAERADASVFAAYVGLGVLSAAGSYRFQHAGYHLSGNQIRAWRHDAYGGLSPAATSYLLAVQLVVRAIEDERLARLLALLPEERRTEVRAEMDRMERAALIDALGLGPPPTWPPEVEAKVVLAPTGTLPKRPRETAKAARSQPKKHPVFRYRGDRRMAGAVLGGSAAAFSGTILWVALHLHGGGMAALLATTLAGGMAGVWLLERTGWAIGATDPGWPWLGPCQDSCRPNHRFSSASPSFRDPDTAC